MAMRTNAVIPIATAGGETLRPKLSNPPSPTENFASLHSELLTTLGKKKRNLSDTEAEIKNYFAKKHPLLKTGSAEYKGEHLQFLKNLQAQLIKRFDFDSEKNVRGLVRKIEPVSPFLPVQLKGEQCQSNNYSHIC